MKCLLDDGARSRLGRAVRAHEDLLRARGSPRQALHAHTDEAEPLR